MNKIYISKLAHIGLKNYLLDKGYTLEYIESKGIVDKSISHHPDIFLCKMGIDENAPVYFAKKETLSADYPCDVPFNAACTGKYFIHNLEYTNPDLLQAAENMGMTTINVKQGYSKCSIVIVDETSIITYDEGIYKACEEYDDLDVLLVSPGFVRLDGYDTGFIGGASGRIGDEVIFNGDLFCHPDFNRIKIFIESRDLKCKWFAGYPLTDIGSIL